MNIISDLELDLEILKALLPESAKSKYILWHELEDKLGREKVNQPTSYRHMNQLVDDGFIRTEKGLRRNGKPDKRKTQVLHLTVKGLVRLILNADLNEKECRVIIHKILSRKVYRGLHFSKLGWVQKISIDSLKKSFRQLRPRVNLKYFDEEYAASVIFETITLEPLLNILHNPDESRPRIQSERKESQSRKKAKHNIEKLSDDDIQLFFLFCAYLKHKRQTWDEKIRMIEPAIEEVKKKRPAAWQLYKQNAEV